MYAAIDVGGTSINIGLYYALDALSQHSFVKLNVKNHFNEDINQIGHWIGTSISTPVKAVGIGVPGIINSESTGIALSENLSDWMGKNLSEAIAAKLKINPEKVFLDNDMNVAATSEAVSDIRNEEVERGNVSNNKFNFLIWGTGIGAAKVDYSTNDTPLIEALDIGFHYISNSIEINKKKLPGYLEYHCGGKKITERFNKAPAELTEDEWGIVLEDLSYGLVNLITHTNTSKIVFGGGVSLKQAHRIEKIEQLVDEKLYLNLTPEFKLAKYGEDAGLVGALALISIRMNS